MVTVVPAELGGVPQEQAVPLIIVSNNNPVSIVLPRRVRWLAARRVADRFDTKSPCVVMNFDVHAPSGLQVITRHRNTVYRI